MQNELQHYNHYHDPADGRSATSKDGVSKSEKLRSKIQSNSAKIADYNAKLSTTRSVRKQAKYDKLQYKKNKVDGRLIFRNDKKSQKLEQKMARVDRKNSKWRAKKQKLEYKNAKLNRKLERAMNREMSSVSSQQIQNGKDALKKYIEEERYA